MLQVTKFNQESEIIDCEDKSDRDEDNSDIIGSNCPGISGTVPDLLTLSLVPENLPICPGKSLISS